LGFVLALGVPMAFAGQTLALRRYRDVDMVPSICLGGVFCFVISGTLGFTSGHVGGGFKVGFHETLLLAAMGILQLAIPLIFYIRGAISVSAVTLTLIAMLDAVINPLWPWIFVGEKPAQAALVGGSIIIGAVLISIFGRKSIQKLFTKKASDVSDNRA
jgi:drug/metabolite transporter, DME family